MVTDKSVILQELDIGYGRKKYRLIDRETGEILHELYDCVSLDYVFESGANTAMLGHGIAISKEKSDTAEYITITDYSKNPPKVMFGFWNNPRKFKRKSIEPKTAGNKKQYVKLYPAQVEKLKPVLVGILAKLAGRTDWATGKMELDNIDELAKHAGCSRATLYRHINALQKQGAIKQENGEYIINRDYVAKG